MKLEGTSAPVLGATGGLDVVVDTMEELFLTNTFVPIMVATASLPAIREGGVLVNISGIIAEQNLPGMAAYGASRVRSGHLSWAPPQGPLVPSGS